MLPAQSAMRPLAYINPVAATLWRGGELSTVDTQCAAAQTLSVAA